MLNKKKIMAESPRLILVFEESNVRKQTPTPMYHPSHHQLHLAVFQGKPTLCQQYIPDALHH